MAKHYDLSIFTTILIAIFLLLLVLCLLFVSPILIYFTFTHTKVFGDYGTLLSGAGSIIGAFLSSFSLIGIIITICLQRKALIEQKEANRTAHIENNLFRLLETHDNIVKTMEYECYEKYPDHTVKKTSYKGSIVFEKMLKTINDLYNIIKGDEYNPYDDKMLSDLNADIYTIKQELSTPKLMGDEWTQNTEKINSNLDTIYNLHINKQYLSKKDWDNYHKENQSQQKAFAVETFVTKQKDLCIGYLRVMKCICYLLSNNRKQFCGRNKVKYEELKRLATSSLSYHEIEVIKLLSYKWDIYKLLITK